MIKRIDPLDWEHSSTIQVDSDASDNMSAIREIEQWATQHGFVRTSEYWLRQAIVSGAGRVYRAICFRPAPEEMLAVQEEERAVEDRMSRIPVTTPQDR